MGHCEHCASTDVHPFTPPTYAGQASVLLCAACQRLTIVTPRMSVVSGRHAPLAVAARPAATRPAQRAA